MVKIAHRDRQHSILKRPIQLLYRLEIHSIGTTSETSLNPEPSKSSLEDNVTELTRPKRAASMEADEVRRRWLTELEKND